MGNIPPPSHHKKTVSLLALGTFVEQFDCMLYMHLAVLLNEDFFPKTDSDIQKLIGAFSFCMPYVLRPLGAFVIGYIGDIKGRKHTIVITTFMMATSCLIMAFLPTYAQIGITSAIILMGCRILQGFAALGEMIGAQLYLTEAFIPPTQYLMVLLIGCAADIGGICALGTAHLTIIYGLNWRIVFLLGAGVAIIGTILRGRLKKDAFWLQPIKNRLPSKEHDLQIKTIHISKIKTALAYCCMLFLWPIGFYFNYIYCSNLLKCNFDYNFNQIITHNLLFSMTSPLVMLVIALFTLKIHPFKIMKVRLLIFYLFIPCIPYILNNITTPNQLLLLQTVALALWPSMRPGESIVFKYFNALQRFRYVSVLFSVAKAIIHLVTSVGMVFIPQHYNNLGILIWIIPIVSGYTVGLYYFEKIEKTHKIA